MSSARLYWLSLLMCVVMDIATGQLEWHQINTGMMVPPDVAPSPRRDPSLGYDSERQRLVVFGGRGDDNGKETVLGDTWIYDLQTDKWREVAAISPPLARFSMVYGVSQGYFYIATGEGADKVFYNDIWRFDLENEKWAELPTYQELSSPTYNMINTQTTSGPPSEDRPTVRYGASGGIYVNASKLYVSHGFSAVRYGDTYSYSLHNNAWYKAFHDKGPYDPGFPQARCLTANTMVTEDTLVMFGGCLSGGRTGGACPSGDTWIFDGKQQTWTETPGCASPRIHGNMAVLPERNGQKRVILYGGEETNRQVLLTVESPADQMAILDPVTMEWSLRRSEGDVPHKRSSVAMATSHEEPYGVYMFGGYDLEAGKLRSDLYLLRGDAATADQAPIESTCNPSFFNLIILHGVLMVLAWGVLLPWGAFIARYVRHKDPLWFNLHRLFQSCGIVLAVGGLICAILSVQFDHFNFVHGMVGLVVMILGLQQPFNALCRPHPPKSGQKKSKRRLVWELFHKFLGRSAIVLALANISLGVFLANAGLELWATWFAYLGFFVLSVIIAEAVRMFKRSNSNRVERRASVLSKDNEITSNGTDGVDTRDLSGQLYMTHRDITPSEEFTKTGFDEPPT